MNPALAGVALAICIGAVVAVSLRDARTVVLGLGVALVGAAVMADPIAATAGIAARVVGAILAVYLLWIAVRDGEATTHGSSLGWPTEAALAAAAAIVGYGTHGLGAVGHGPALAQAVGFAVAALAVTPLVTGRDVLRVGIGLQLLMLGALLVRVALDGTPSTLEQLVTAGLVVGLGGAVAVLASAARRDGSDGFDLAVEARPRGRRVPERRSRTPDTLPLWSSDAFPADTDRADDR